MYECTFPACKALFVGIALQFNLSTPELRYFTEAPYSGGNYPQTVTVKDSNGRNVAFCSQATIAPPTGFKILLGQTHQARSKLYATCWGP